MQDWDKATAIIFNEDQRGVEHEFTDVKPGMFIDVFNAANEGNTVLSASKAQQSSALPQCRSKTWCKSHFHVEDGVDLLRLQDRATHVRRAGNAQICRRALRLHKNATSSRPVGEHVDINLGCNKEVEAFVPDQDLLFRMYKCYVDNMTGANNIFQGKLKGD